MAAAATPRAADGAAPPQTLALTVTAVDTTFVTEDHFIASVEMQLVGRAVRRGDGPRPRRLQRATTSARRTSAQPSIYDDPDSTDGTEQVDSPGYSSAVESYEYSKQPMNNIAFESGAGTSLLFGPVLNPTRRDRARTRCSSRRPGSRTWACEQQRRQPLRERRSSADNAARLAGPLADAAAVHVVEPGDRADATTTGCSLSSDDNPGAARRAARRRLRVRLHDAAPAEPRRAGRR